MLFISPHVRFLIAGVVKEKIHYHPANGKEIGRDPAINVEFSPYVVPAWAIQLALDNDNFQSSWRGLPDDANRQAYVSGYDTLVEQRERGWTDELRTHIEEALLSSPLRGQMFILAEKTLPPLPWPNYPTTHHNKIAALAKELDAVDLALDYERETKNRESVIAALEAELASV